MKYPLLSKIYLVLCWVLFIFILLIFPIPEQGGDLTFTLYDKFFHFFLFGVLSGLIAWLFRGQRKLSGFSFNLIIFVLVLAYILSMEHLQQFIPYRDPCWWDALGGVSGAFLGLLFVNSYFERF